MNHFRRKEMLKSSIPISIEIKLQMPPDTSKDTSKNGNVESGPLHQLVLSFNTGGLWSVTLPAVNIFLKTGNYFRQSTVNVGLHKIDIVTITLNSSMDSDVLTNYDLILSEYKPDFHVRKGVLHDILSLHIRVHSVTGNFEMIAMLILCTMQHINSGMNIITNNLCFSLLGTNTMQTLKTAVRMMHLQPKKEHCNIACP